MSNQQELKLSSEYLALDDRLYTIMEPKKNEKSEIVLLNEELAKDLEFEVAFLKSKEGITFLSGSTNKYGRLYAQAYAGHQYGHFTMLGDGRALVLGEKETIHNEKVELQLKGSGTTPYSRSGDGKATLYSVLREHLISEAMHFLGVPTTRSLGILKTNETIRRNELEQGGILCRVASSHLRVGTFQYSRALDDLNLVKELADFAIKRHYPDIKDTPEKYQLFLRNVIKRQAILVSKWQSIGFIHGVMNTDNVTISGETIDYGPCAFMDTYKSDTVFSSIDRNGRYAYKQQPFITSWNVARFAESMVHLLATNEEEAVLIANDELGKFEEYYQTSYYNLMAKKIGIIDPVIEEKSLINDLLLIMEKYKADYTNTFRLLTLDKYDELPFYNTVEWKKWFQKWTRFLGTRQMNIESRVKLMEQSNPVIIPRNSIVEKALVKASKEDDFTLYNELLDKLKSPYNYRNHYSNKFLEPAESNESYITYCGT